MSLFSLSLWFSTSAIGTAIAGSVLIQPAEQAQWQLDSSAFHCRLQQRVSGLGQVSFALEPGQPLQLDLELAQPYPALEQATVAARSADWQPDTIQPESLPYIAELYHESQVSFLQAALPLFQQVQAGAWLQFELGNGRQQQQLLLTSVRGHEAVEQFRGCVAKMSPLSWQQARDTDIVFASGQRLVDRTQLPVLQKLARYLQLDPSVKKILIDGHTDDVGTVLANRQLSKERADEVAARLIELGVKASMLEVRAHGNRYPLLHSQGKAEQSNRRVSIRLIRTTS
ncbi:outer membrane protein OmpA-like peptidoglycan-associated protein [Rheinheimera pacifica]|uniref:OmpA family protein n=1 Tax=Rheinheimera pacifica TaxID=173990 RepID=UPI0028668259|nr:OmpA family protein [Rheinheimera pacifica]MDR6984298.1 outer membrane protein OmpA-like peptidoglycan-associated protein [Rheinheimera pacifica]